MALVGQKFVEAGLARLKGVLPPSPRPANLRLKPTSLPSPDHLSLSVATAIYSGQNSLSVEDFSNLKWLEHFGQSGRHLLMCHALKLLEGWNKQAIAVSTLEEETALLQRLARSSGKFAAALDHSLLQPLSVALRCRINHLLARRVQRPSDQLAKALTLLEVARSIEDGFALTKESARILEFALPQLVATDGGPITHSLVEYASWIASLLDETAVDFQPLTRNSLDRARSFLSMLVDQNSEYCFDRNRTPHHEVVSTPPLRLANSSGVARLQVNKCLLISLPSTLCNLAQLHISSHGHRLLAASHFCHDQNEASSQHNLQIESQDQGHLLQVSMGKIERAVFISPEGEDIRVEDILPSDGLKRWMQLEINTGSKISVSHGGTVATIARDNKHIWQLTLRGARIVPNNNGTVALIETSSSTINWALKRLVRSTSRAGKPDSLELPF